MFEVVERLISDVEPFDRLPVTSGETYARGEALVLTSGTLTKCGATVKPKYIVYNPTPDAQGKLLVIKVQPWIKFKTTSTATVAATLIGSAVTLHTDGLKVTATTTSGVFTIRDTDGATTNSTVMGYFE